MIIHVVVDDPTPQCPTCGDSRVASLRWGGAWTPEPCPDCSLTECQHARATRDDVVCPDCGAELTYGEVT